MEGNSCHLNAETSRNRSEGKRRKVLSVAAATQRQHTCPPRATASASESSDTHWSNQGETDETEPASRTLIHLQCVSCNIIALGDSVSPDIRIGRSSSVTESLRVARSPKNPPTTLQQVIMHALLPSIRPNSKPCRERHRRDVGRHNVCHRPVSEILGPHMFGIMGDIVVEFDDVREGIEASGLELTRDVPKTELHQPERNAPGATIAWRRGVLRLAPQLHGLEHALHPS